MSFDSNTGNINWQRRFRNGNGIVLDTIGLKYDNDDLYVSGTQNNGGFMIKVPSDGAIPGNGTYSGNLTYTVSNVAISNANIAITTSNITLSNAVSTAVTTSNITANTANLYTFNSTRLT
jgi:hypothetical protein